MAWRQCFSRNILVETVRADLAELLQGRISRARSLVNPPLAMPCFIGTSPNSILNLSVSPRRTLLPSRVMIVRLLSGCWGRGAAWGWDSPTGGTLGPAPPPLLLNRCLKNLYELKTRGEPGEQPVMPMISIHIFARRRPGPNQQGSWEVSSQFMRHLHFTLKSWFYLIASTVVRDGT